MARCPKCRGEVANPRKSWKMAGRPDRTGKKTELTIGLFDCPRCKKPFRVVLGKRKIWGASIAKRSARAKRAENLAAVSKVKMGLKGVEI